MDGSVLSLSLITSVLIFFSIAFLGKHGPLIFVTALGVLSVLWGWMTPTENEVFAFRILILVISILVIVRNGKIILAVIRRNLSNKVYPILLINIVVIFGAILVKYFQPKFLYEVMFNGYDNYGHLAVFYRTFDLNGFEYSPRAQIEIPNLLAANGYPLLVHTVWTVILRLFNFQIENSDSLIQLFVYFSILSLLYLSYLVILLILTKFKRVAKFELYAVVLLVLLLIYLAQFSTLVLQGFAPTLAGIIFTFTVYVVLKIEISSNLKAFLLYSNVILTGYSYQLFVPIAYLGTIAFLYAELKSKSKRNFYGLLFISHLGLLLAAMPLISVSRAIPSYLFAHGGIQPPHTSLLLTIFILNLTLLFFRKCDVVSIAYLASTALAGGLIAWAVINDVGYYYALKIVYLSLLLGIVSGIVNFSSFKPFMKINAMLFSLALITTASVLLANQSSVFKKITAIQILTSENFKNPCVESQYNAVISEKVFASSNTLFVFANAGLNSDLGTRQMNAINGRWDNDVYNFSIPYGQAENQEQFLNSYQKNNQSTKFLIFDYSSTGCRLVKRS